MAVEVLGDRCKTDMINLKGNKWVLLGDQSGGS